MCASTMSAALRSDFYGLVILVIHVEQDVAWKKPGSKSNTRPLWKIYRGGCRMQKDFRSQHRSSALAKIILRQSGPSIPPTGPWESGIKTPLAEICSRIGNIFSLLPQPPTWTRCWTHWRKSASWRCFLGHAYSPRAHDSKILLLYVIHLAARQPILPEPSKR